MFELKKYEFQNKKYDFRAKKGIASEYNFYKNRLGFEDITLAIKGFELKMVDNIIVNASKTENNFGVTLWVSHQEIDTESKEYGYCLLSEIRGITKEKAISIFETSDAKNINELIEYLNNNRVKGIGKKKVELIKEKFEEAKNDDLITKLNVILENINHAKKIAQKIEKIKELYENPYQILKFLNLGFIKADEIARRKLNISLDNKSRIYHMTEYKFNQFNVKQANYINLDEFKDYILSEVAYIKGDIDTFLKENELLVVEDEKVYLKAIYEAETRTPNLLLMNNKVEVGNLRSKIIDLECNSSIELSDNQKESIISIMDSEKVSILTGEAGTGKSTITRFLVELLNGTKCNTALLAPTGKASARMSKCCQMDANTIHSLMYFLESDFANPYFTMKKYGISGDFVLIIDEFSMVDQLLFYKLLKNINDCDFLNLRKIVVIGDPYQLPSVGCGQVMVDMINSKRFNHVHLTETFRQLSNSNIVKNAKLVRNKKTINTTLKEKDFYVGELTENNINRMFYVFEDKFQNKKDFYKNVQLVTSTNKMKDKINEMFKVEDTQKNGFKFQAGDKIINLKNNNELGISNGDFGIIEKITKKDATIFFIDKEERMIFSKSDLINISLAYACTTHKLQGSEYETIIIILENSLAVSNYRSLYTAITRGKKNVIILAKTKKDIIEVCKRDFDYRRKTEFRLRLQRVLPKK